MEPERSFLSTLTNLAPYHLLGFGALLGTELYQTFFMTKVCYRALPMSAFTTLQKKVFPIYFSLQGILVAFTIVTYPPHGIASLSKSIADLSLLSFAGVMSLLNIVRYGPRTTSAMVERIHQGAVLLKSNASRHKLIVYFCMQKPEMGENTTTKISARRCGRSTGGFQRSTPWLYMSTCWPSWHQLAMECDLPQNLVLMGNCRCRYHSLNRINQNNVTE